MKEYLLPKTKDMAQIDILDSANLTAILALQDEVRAALPINQKNFITPRGTAYFQNLLARHTGLMVGIRTEGKLVAQMSLIGPMDLREALGLSIITPSQVPFAHAALSDNIVILKDLIIHPDWAEDQLAGQILSFALDLPFCQVADHLFTESLAANKASWGIFAAYGFGIVSATTDLKDGQPHFILQKPSFGFDFAPAIIVDDVDPLIDFPAIVNLTQREALVGVFEENSNNRLAFFRSRDVLNIVPTLAKVQSQYS
jgi:hypothetical protein